MELEKYKYEARALMLRMAKLTVEAAANEDIKKEPQIQHKMVSTALTLLIEAETLEKELTQLNLRSDNSISE